MTKCLNCEKITKNPKFCNRSCAASYNNVLFPKRKKTSKIGICSICKEQVPYRRKYCNTCRKLHDPNYKDWSKVSLQEIQNSRKYQVNSRIRMIARKVFWNHHDQKTYKCPNCSYSKHIDVCHIKPINRFKGQTKISEINNISNLIGLCKNCHWEFDHGC